MYCRTCGKFIEDNVSHCSYCGTSAAVAENENNCNNSIFYQLLPTDHRKYSLKVYQDRLAIDGRFWYLRDKEFILQNGNATAFIHNYLGMGYLSMRSYKKTLAFVFGGVILGTIKTIIDKLSDLADKANFFLGWIGQTFTLPEWLNTIFNMAVVICIILAIILFFSKKKVVEISFTDKRICIPQKSISQEEYYELYQTIKNLLKK